MASVNKPQKSSSNVYILVAGVLLGLFVAGTQFSLRHHPLPDSRDTVGRSATFVNLQGVTALQVGLF